MLHSYNLNNKLQVICFYQSTKTNYGFLWADLANKSSSYGDCMLEIDTMSSLTILS